MKKLIMGFGTNQTRVSLEVFLRSAREVWSPDEAEIFLVTNSESGIGDILRENTANIFPTTNIFKGYGKQDSRILNRILMQSLCILSNSKLGRGERFLEGYYSILETLAHPHLARWFAYRRMLRIYNEYDGIILADIRDVQFQSDIFSFAAYEGVKVFQDCGGFSTNTSNGQWYIDAYGKKAFDAVRNHVPICVGVMLGQTAPIREMIDRFCIEIAKAPFGKIEQAIFNHHFFKGHFADDVEALSNITHGVANLSSPEEYRPKIRIADDRICLQDGTAIPVIHMYDRDETANALVNRRYGLSQ